MIIKSVNKYMLLQISKHSSTMEHMGYNYMIEERANKTKKQIHKQTTRL